MSMEVETHERLGRLFSGAKETAVGTRVVDMGEMAKDALLDILPKVRERRLISAYKNVKQTAGRLKIQGHTAIGNSYIPKDDSRNELKLQVQENRDKWIWRPSDVEDQVNIVNLHGRGVQVIRQSMDTDGKTILDAQSCSLEPNAKDVFVGALSSVEARHILHELDGLLEHVKLIQE